MKLRKNVFSLMAWRWPWGSQIAVKWSKANDAIICPLNFKAYSHLFQFLTEEVVEEEVVSDKTYWTTDNVFWNTKKEKEELKLVLQRLRELALLLNSSFCCLVNCVRIVLSLKRETTHSWNLFPPTAYERGVGPSKNWVAWWEGGSKFFARKEG